LVVPHLMILPAALYNVTLLLFLLLWRGGPILPVRWAPSVCVCVWQGGGGVFSLAPPQIIYNTPTYFFLFFWGGGAHFIVGGGALGWWGGGGGGGGGAFYCDTPQHIYTTPYISFFVIYMHYGKRSL